MGLAGMAVETAGVEGMGSVRLAGPADDLFVKELLLGVPVFDHDPVNLHTFVVHFAQAIISRQEQRQAKKRMQWIADGWCKLAKLLICYDNIL